MNRKTLLAWATLAFTCLLIAWFLGRQIGSPPTPPAPSQPAPSQPAPSQPAMIAKLTAPATPIHEKAFLELQLKANPNHAPILLRLGELERSEGKLNDARRHLELALKKDPSLIDAHLELSLVCYQLGDAAEAEKQNRSVLKLDPKQPDALYNLGAIYANQNRFPEARRFWNDAIKFGPGTASGKNAADGLAKLPAL